MKRLVTGIFAATLLAGLCVPTVAHAQRRVLGAEEDKEEEVDAKEAEKRQKAKEEKERKAKEKAEAEEKRRAEKEAAAEAAAAAAEKAAEEAERKKEEDAKKAEEAKKAAIEKKKAADRKSRLTRAKKRRRLFRVDGDVRATLSLEPGKPEPAKVEEVQFEIVRQLKVAHPRYGFLEPLKQMKLVATVIAPSARGEATEERYRVHSLGTPGQYGFHYTPTIEGEHQVRVRGKTKKGTEVLLEFPLHVGTWPPPDLDEEDEKLEKALEVGTGGGGGRRIVGGN